MNKIMAILLATLSASTYAGEVEDGTDGIYAQKVGTGSHDYKYIVDTKTQMCFVVGSFALSVIPCEKLRLRDEWKPIITWIK